MQSFHLFLLCLAVALTHGEQISYKNHQVLSIIPYEDSHYELLDKLQDEGHIDIWNDIHRNASVHIMFDSLKSTWLFRLFESLNLKPQVMIPSVQKLLDDENRAMRIKARAGVRKAPRTDYLNYDEIGNWLMEQVQKFPNMATLTSIGKTYENRNIWLIKLTAPNGGKKRRAFLDFGIHAREWISPSTGLYMIEELLENYGKTTAATTMMNNWEFHIVPVLNPDGYAYSHLNQNTRLWRKNRRQVTSSCIGVDLNRNFGYKFNTGGSSSSACSDTYHGGTAMSENEAKALESYMPNYTWDTYLTVHSYGQYWFTVWGWNTTLPSNFDLLKSKADIGAAAIKAKNGRTYSVGSSSKLLYIASGGSEDWTTGVLKIDYSYCLELPQVNNGGFVVPTTKIVEIGDETFAGVVAYLNAI